MSCVGTVTGIRNILHVSLVKLPVIFFFVLQRCNGFIFLGSLHQKSAVKLWAIWHTNTNSPWSLFDLDVLSEHSFLLFLLRNNGAWLPIKEL